MSAAVPPEGAHSAGSAARDDIGREPAGTVRLRIENASKRFPAADGNETVAVQDVSLRIEQGEFLVIVGPSGCGKTTVLNMLAGLQLASSGKVLFDDVPIMGPGPARGVMFQDYALFPWCTVWDNVGFGLRHGPAGAGMTPAQRDERIRHYVSLVGLTGSEKKFPHQLSGGMRQRVALARLMANEPAVLLMDEPLAALDAQTRIILQDELVRIWGQDRPRSERRTIVFITHAIDEAVFLADRIVVMTTHPGRVKAIIDVDLPRPRGDTTRALPAFQALTQKIWNLIRDEAYRATVT